MHRLHVVLASCLALALAGCRQSVDLDAVRALAHSAAESERSFGALAGDFRDSCSRQVGWTNIYSGQNRDPAAVCAESAKAARQWGGLNEIVLDYFRALGDVAGNADDGKNDYGMKSLADAVDKLGNPLHVADAPSAASLAADLTHDLFDARRRDAAALGIDAAAPHLSSAIATLKKVDDRYRFQIGNESAAVEQFFTPVSAANVRAGGANPDFAQTLLINSNKNVERYALDQLRLRLLAERRSLDDRRSAADAYSSALDNMQAAHDGLLAAVRDRRPSALRSIVTRYFADYKTEITTINKAFGLRTDGGT